MNNSDWCGGWRYPETAAPQPPALDRDGIIEACAKAVDDLAGVGTSQEIAAAIRALKVQS
jgi:hypothetical protein